MQDIKNCLAPFVAFLVAALDSDAPDAAALAAAYITAAEDNPCSSGALNPHQMAAAADEIIMQLEEKLNSDSMNPDPYERARRFHVGDLSGIVAQADRAQCLALGRDIALHWPLEEQGTLWAFIVEINNLGADARARIPALWLIAEGFKGARSERFTSQIARAVEATGAGTDNVRAWHYSRLANAIGDAEKKALQGFVRAALPPRSAEEAALFEVRSLLAVHHPILWSKVSPIHDLCFKADHDRAAQARRIIAAAHSGRMEAVFFGDSLEARADAMHCRRSWAILRGNILWSLIRRDQATPHIDDSDQGRKSWLSLALEVHAGKFKSWAQAEREGYDKFDVKNAKQHLAYFALALKNGQVVDNFED